MSSQEVRTGILVSAKPRRRKPRSINTSVMNPPPAVVALRPFAPALAGAAAALALVALGLIVAIGSRRPSEIVRMPPIDSPPAAARVDPPIETATKSNASPASPLPVEVAKTAAVTVLEAQPTAPPSAKAKAKSAPPVLAALKTAPIPAGAEDIGTTDLSPTPITVKTGYILKRRQLLDQEDLARQLLTVRELDVEAVPFTTSKLHLGTSCRLEEAGVFRAGTLARTAARPGRPAFSHGS